MTKNQLQCKINLADLGLKYTDESWEKIKSFTTFKELKLTSTSFLRNRMPLQCYKVYLRFLIINYHLFEDITPKVHTNTYKSMSMEMQNQISPDECQKFHERLLARYGDVKSIVKNIDHKITNLERKYQQKNVQQYKNCQSQSISNISVSFDQISEGDDSFPFSDDSKSDQK